MKYLLSLVFLVLSHIAFSQKYIGKGDKYYNRNLFEEAIPYYQKEIETGKFKYQTEAREKLADCYRLTGRFNEAEDMYKYLLDRGNKRRNPDYYLNYANSLKSSAKYEEAAEQFKIYMQNVPDDPMGPIYLESCFLSQSWLDLEPEFHVKNAEVLNTDASDFSPVFYKEGIVFSSSREGSERQFISLNDDINVTRMDLYYLDLKRKDGEFKEISGLDIINSYQHESAPTFSSDGTEVYFTRTITGIKDKKSNTVLNSLQVYYSQQTVDGTWTEPESAFDFNSPEYSIGQPSLSEDGKRIYFVSDMPGGHGGTDIYYCEKRWDGDWGEPINLGKSVNTFGHELFPYIHGNDTLYFSSDTHPGMGKLDIFQAIRNGRRFENVSNMKTPINSIGNDFGICFDESQERGFFSSDRFNGKGAEDIYSFTKILPIRVIIADNELLIEDLEIFDGISHKIKEEGGEGSIAITPSDGYFRYPMKKDLDYELMSRKDNFFYNKTIIKLHSDLAKDQLVASANSMNRDVQLSRKLAMEVMFTVKHDSDGSDSKSKKKIENPIDTIYESVPLENIYTTLIADDMLVEDKTSGESGSVRFSSILERGVPYFIYPEIPEDLPEKLAEQLKEELENENEEIQIEEIDNSGVLAVIDSLEQSGEKNSGSTNEANASEDAAKNQLAENGENKQEDQNTESEIKEEGDLLAENKEEGSITQQNNTLEASDSEKQALASSGENVKVAATIEGFEELSQQGHISVYLMDEGFPVKEITPDSEGNIAFNEKPGNDYSIMIARDNIPTADLKISIPEVDDDEIVSIEIPEKVALGSSKDPLSPIIVKEAEYTAMLTGQSQLEQESTDTELTKNTSSSSQLAQSGIENNTSSADTEEKKVTMKGAIEGYDELAKDGHISVFILDEGFPVQEVVPDSKGNFTFEQLPGDDYSIMIAKDDKPGGEIKITIPDVEESELASIVIPKEITMPQNQVKQDITNSDNQLAVNTTSNSSNAQAKTDSRQNEVKTSAPKNLAEKNQMQIKGNIASFQEFASKGDVTVLLMEDGFPVAEVKPDADGSFSFTERAGKDYSIMLAQDNLPAGEYELKSAGREAGDILEVDIRMSPEKPGTVNSEASLNSYSANGSSRESKLPNILADNEGSIENKANEDQQDGNSGVHTNSQTTDLLHNSPKGLPNSGMNENINSGTVTNSSSTSVVNKKKMVLRGSISEEITNSSLAGTKIILLEDEFPVAETNTGSDGSFSFEVDPNKNYTVLAVKDGYISQEMDFKAENNSSLQELVMRMPGETKTSSTGDQKQHSNTAAREQKQVEEKQNENTSPLSNTEKVITDFDDPNYVPSITADNIVVEDWEISFSVQIGAYSKNVNNSTVRRYQDAAGKYKLKQFRDDRGLLLFQVGLFDDYYDAEGLRKQMTDNGIEEAFVIAYNFGKRVSVTKAREVTGALEELSRR